jgi:glycosyltransferase involved in cell wall biosynthesis
MKISYAITVKDELIELDRLLFRLQKYKRNIDEIVVVHDGSNGSPQVEQYLKAQTVSSSPFRWHSFKFKNNFSELKNYITQLCTGDYIFQIDADEFPNEYLVSILPTILESNPETEVYLTPRVNTVEGLTEQHIQKWGWRVDENGWINFPDYQWRIWKNKPEIKWINKVHERLEGFKTYVALPPQEEFSLYHPKDIERQEKQNNYYNTL